MASILLFEDDAFLSKAYQIKLQKAGFEVRVAFDGQEGLDALQEFKPDVILLDLVMPKMDGFTTLERIKQDEALSKIPVIVASNLGQAEDIARAKELGAQEFLIKSDVSLEEVIELVEKYLSDKT